MRTFAAVAASALLLALIWGAAAGTQPVPSRDRAHGVAVTPDWYSTLPLDPAVATQAFLGRIPAEARARGDAFGATRYITLPLRIGVLLGSVALLMFSGAAARMRGLARRVSRRMPLQDAAFAFQMLAALFVLNLPVETYAGFVRMRSAGFSQAPFLAWLTDVTIAWATQAPFYVAGLVAILALIRSRPRSWVSWATVVYVVVSASYLLIEPQFIEPLFNRVGSLADGPQKQAILSLARANGVPAADVFVRDASRQSALLDAHVSGIGGTARIVLDDNTIAQTSAAEVQMVLAHEIGHYVLAHRAKGMVFDGLVMGVGILLVGWAGGRLVARYGPAWNVGGLGDVGALPVLWGLFLLWGYLALPVTNGITRQQEVEADMYGLNASQQPLALAEYMIRDADTGQVDPSPIEEWVFFSHPSPRNRIYAAMRWRSEQRPGG